MLDRLLSRLHAWIVDCPVFARLTLLVRVALASGFVLPGLTKLLGNRFTLLGPETPIGAFFEAMYDTGLYWRFLGLTQVLASLLIIIPRTTTLGAMLFFGIILNIFVITVSLSFTGTWIVTGAMLLAASYLLLWDYPRLRPLLGWGAGEALPARAPLGLRWFEIVGAVIAVPGAFYGAILARQFEIVTGAGFLVLAAALCASGMGLLFARALPLVVRRHVWPVVGRV